MQDRWPPVYDADDLVREIRSLTQGPDFETSFYEWHRDRHTTSLDDVCQGDIVTFPSGVPVIGEDAQPGVISNKTGAWMVIGNTCDFDRDLHEARWTQVVPLLDLGGSAIAPSLRDALRKYTQFRSFYVPPWSGETETRYHAAQFLLAAAVDKAAFRKSIKVEARLSRPAWILLNACLVRFLARDDGRYAA